MRAVFIRDEAPVARKNHRCWLCGLVILTGERHIVRTCKDDVIGSFRMHERCELVSQQFRADDWETLPDEVAFRELLSESK